jgi:rhodanese-related sulfurtransferase
MAAVSLKKRIEEARQCLSAFARRINMRASTLREIGWLRCRPSASRILANTARKTPVFRCRSARTSFNASLLLSKGFRDAYGLSGGFIAWKPAELATRSKRDASGEGGGKPFGWL